MQLPHSFLWRHRTGRSQPMLAGSFCLQREAGSAVRQTQKTRLGKRLDKAVMTIKKI